MSAKRINELKRRGVRVVFAESCTGGLASYSLAKTPGASDVLEASIVTYSNAAKIKLLGVSARTIDRFGAVSGETALEMTRGALKRVRGANVAVAITGIAGPTGATPGKPVGTVWFAVANRSGRAMSMKKRFRGTRAKIQSAAADWAVRLSLEAE